MKDLGQFWKGRLFTPAAVDRGHLEFQRLTDRYGPLISLQLETLPFRAEIAYAKAKCPQAIADLNFWQESWERSFPDWEESAKPARDARPPLENELAAYLEADVRPGDAHTALHLERRAEEPHPVAVATQHENTVGFLFHKILRSARMFSAAARLGAYTTSVGYNEIDGRRCHAIFGTVGDDGLVRMFTTNESANAEGRVGPSVVRELYRLATESRCDLTFWEWPFLISFLNRTVFGVHAFDHENFSRAHDRSDNGRSIPLAGAIADLAAHGEAYAVVTPHEVNGMSHGSLLLDLSSVNTIGQAYSLLTRELPQMHGATVEKHADYRAARRYFFHDGELLGGSPLAEDADPYDGWAADGIGAGQKGHWLLKASCECTKLESYAIEVAAVLATEGIKDFALDVGIPDPHGETHSRASVEVLSVMELWTAKTLSFDPQLLCDALARERRVYLTLLAAGIDRNIAALPDETTRRIIKCILGLFGNDALLASAAGHMRSYIVEPMHRMIDVAVEEAIKTLGVFLLSKGQARDCQSGFNPDDHDDWTEVFNVDTPLLCWLHEHPEEIDLIVGNIATPTVTTV